jgi:hypothetical protein
MRLPDLIIVVGRADFFISHQATGTPKEFSEKLKISKSSWFRLQKTLIEEGHCPIVYSKCCRSYCYSEKGHLELLRFKKEE